MELPPLFVAVLLASAEESDVVDDEGAADGTTPDTEAVTEARTGAGADKGLPPYCGVVLMSSALLGEAGSMTSSTVLISATIFFKCFLLPLALARQAAARASLRCESWSSKPYKSYPVEALVSCPGKRSIPSVSIAVRTCCSDES